MRRLRLPIYALVALILLIPGAVPVRAQDAGFPLPAPLYILTSEGTLLQVNPATGTQTQISNQNQPVADFDIAPDGQWVVFRTAQEGAVIVARIIGPSGYVLEFDSVAPASGPAQTIAWSPDASAIAYLVPEGVRIAYPGEGMAGEPQLGLVRGPWVELYWEDLDTLIVSDESGTATRIRGRYQQWTLEAAPDLAARPQPVVPSYLAPDGVVIRDTGPVPGTAGALAFDWGPSHPDRVTGYPLPADLTFLAPDANGNDQVWRLPANGNPAQQITQHPEPVVGYSVSPDGARLAYVSGDQVVMQDRSDITRLASLERDEGPITPHWSPDGRQIAYHDLRGVWVVLADGSQSPQIVARSTLFSEQTGPGDVRFYTDPQWNADGSRLLLSVGLWESAQLAVYELGTDTLTALPHVTTGSGRWSGDGNVVAWSWFYIYSRPGLFLADPAQPDAEPIALIAETPVYDVRRGPGERWYVLTSTPVQAGPRFLRVRQATALDAAFNRVFPAQVGGFVDAPALFTDGTQFVIAGTQPRTSDQIMAGVGVLHLIDLGQNRTVQLAQPAPVHAVQWTR